LLLLRLRLKKLSKVTVKKKAPALSAAAALGVDCIFADMTCISRERLGKCEGERLGQGQRGATR